ncbi:hypothetical protein GL263_18920 [Streptomyces durbertensis]|uniref:Uncharacterized protein n=1 Tax=Streptomyces durbertensis TaxID=2448886 RepID=A0ABR6EJX1_9ACTN|nr:hypothetical protein [Streptomyces durbertensis]MBB1245615.1 hypothetical protein [Streptomyces durbertensis]
MSGAAPGGYPHIPDPDISVTAGCEACAQLHAPAQDKEQAGDHSAATDYRVLLRRHRANCAPGRIS